MFGVVIISNIAGKSQTLVSLSFDWVSSILHFMQVYKLYVTVLVVP